MGYRDERSDERQTDDGGAHRPPPTPAFEADVGWGRFRFQGALSTHRTIYCQHNCICLAIVSAVLVTVIFAAQMQWTRGAAPELPLRPKSAIL
jgi:hypothetical protein